MTEQLRSWWERFKSDEREAMEQFPYEKAADKLEAMAMPKVEQEVSAILHVYQKLAAIPGEARPRVLRYIQELLSEAP